MFVMSGIVQWIAPRWCKLICYLTCVSCVGLLRHYGKKIMWSRANCFVVIHCILVHSTSHVGYCRTRLLVWYDIKTIWFLNIKFMTTSFLSRLLKFIRPQFGIFPFLIIINIIVLVRHRFWWRCVLLHIKNQTLAYFFSQSNNWHHHDVLLETISTNILIEKKMPYGLSFWIGMKHARDILLS